MGRTMPSWRIVIEQKMAELSGFKQFLRGEDVIRARQENLWQGFACRACQSRMWTHVRGGGRKERPPCPPSSASAISLAMKEGENYGTTWRA